MHVSREGQNSACSHCHLMHASAGRILLGILNMIGDALDVASVVSGLVYRRQRSDTSGSLKKFGGHAAGLRMVPVGT